MPDTPATPVIYQAFRRLLEIRRANALALVTAAETLLGTVPEAELTPERLLTAAGLRPDAIQYPPRVWAAWLGNTARLRGVKRIDRAPYATHPTRMALVCLAVLGDGGVDAAVAAILHDYLEEG